ncbi:MCE family protein [Mycolicibacterium sp. BiH015]|uniref:MCE family protein n=1 Tax=Mycolicibacterium sp. BiH015 TaxID=3018808 RepID=UPI0022E8123C|nr:MCE family protein [Mycolicibacterium sp. BiH015]MDA2893252.1 MCE family protein [Mycolicibacterium sp. BiH015]
MRFTTGRLKVTVALTLVALAAAATYVVTDPARDMGRIHVTAYFENTNGVFVGDDVRIRGVTVGEIDAIEPQPMRSKVSFWYDDQYRVPADAKAVILSPTLVTARAIQLTPAYTAGATLANGAVIERDRTAVPIEFDDFRGQLEKLTKLLAPTEPGGVSTLGALINSTADNLRGQGPSIRDAVIRLSGAVSALSDHSADTFGTVKNLATLVTALQDSTTLIRQLNANLAEVTGVLANDPDEVATAMKDLNEVVVEVRTFVAENRDTLGTTTDKLTAVSQVLNDSLADIEQLLHVLPTTAANAANLYQPAQGTLSGVAAVNNFSDPINFLCGAVQAASRLGAEQSAKLCVQYLAPIVKNRQYNFPPLGFNPFVGTAARPNEVTYSEDWMRPDFRPSAPAPAPSPPLSAPGPGDPAPTPPLPLAAEAPLAQPAQQTDPAAGLPGMMLPAEAGQP